ncbi:DUF998 domain-containing protein [Lysobacter niabensis]|uniref:DUF998 domain-containing protein n=1 Tax=Agrilutibacter niabensis TaxID=380628 RepID=UPI00360E7EE0
MNAQVSILSSMASLVSRHAAAWAALVFVLALAGLSGSVDGYSHLQHPVAWLGAQPLPHATAFNLLVFVVPGLLVAWMALRLRTGLSPPGEAGGKALAGWVARIGAQLVLLSALAFALQGILPLDATDLDGARSGRHAAAWMAWWIAFATGCGALAIGLRSDRRWHTTAALSSLAAVLVPACALVLPHLLPAGLAQRLAFALWFAWAIHSGETANRRAQP